MRESRTSPNDRLRTVAYSFFEHHPDRALIGDLLTALDQEQGEFVRPSLVRALVAHGAMFDDPRIRQMLLGEVGRGEDYFRSAVIEALGDYKALYAYAQEDADFWAAELGVDLPPGWFGENLRVDGLDVNRSRIGERWRIGETAVVGNNCSFLHAVTLGGSGKETGDRHPKIGENVLIGAGAKVLGNITVGDGSRIAAGSVVLHDVPAHVTVAGVPAKIVGPAGSAEPALEMEQTWVDDFGGL